MSKGKQYLNTLFAEGIEKYLNVNETSNRVNRSNSHIQRKAPRSSNPVKLGSYVQQKSKFRHEDGKGSTLNFLPDDDEINIPNKVINPPPLDPYVQKMKQLKQFVMDHIDSEDNYFIFLSLLKNFESLNKQNRKSSFSNQIQNITTEYSYCSIEDSPTEKKALQRMSCELSASTGNIINMNQSSTCLGQKTVKDTPRCSVFCARSQPGYQV